MLYETGLSQEGPDVPEQPALSNARHLAHNVVWHFDSDSDSCLLCMPFDTLALL